MSATLPSIPPIVPRSLVDWASDFVRACYRERLRRAGQPECGLCLHRNDFTRCDCERCGAPLSEETAPCMSCGKANTEHEVELARGFCARCGARWIGTSERTPVLVPYAVPVGGDEEMPI